MPTRRVLRSVLWNFLGTYTSRYSDYDGYWLFGFLIHELGSAEFDLLAELDHSEDVAASTHRLAAREFADQLAKSGLDRSYVARATLFVDRQSAATHIVDGHQRGGWNYRFAATATTDTGRQFRCATVIFVAPHDRRVEHRSARARGTPRVSGTLDL